MAGIFRTISEPILNMDQQTDKLSWPCRGLCRESVSYWTAVEHPFGATASLMCLIVNETRHLHKICQVENSWMVYTAKYTKSCDVTALREFQSHRPQWAWPARRVPWLGSNPGLLRDTCAKQRSQCPCPLGHGDTHFGKDNSFLGGGTRRHTSLCRWHN